ncbi:MAG: histidine phosphatase family protein [Desulfobacterales bacterium]|nr:histidine phosphatase family protein [Desulfobacterales bacterium]
MIEVDPITHFGILRHAETQWNLQKRIQGQNDSPLTFEGIQQARSWGLVLKDQVWDQILTSDIGRALKTATLINIYLRIGIKCDKRLREQDWGRWSGKTLADLKKEEPALLSDQEKAGWKFCPPGGESRRTVLKRSMEALKEATAKWSGKNILVVTHESVIKCLTYYFSARRFLPSEPSLLLGNYLHRLKWDSLGLGIDKINALDLTGA